MNKTPAQKAAETKAAKKAAARPSAERYATLQPNASILVVLPGYQFTCPSLMDTNNVLEALGYKPLRVTRNMLNENSKEFLIDADTPSYCDPGCESYHSM